MPEFAYRAVDRNGTVATGTLAVEHESLLDAQLHELGLWVIESSPLSQRKPSRGARASRRDLADFCAAMAALLHAGVTLAEALETLAEESANPDFQLILIDIAHRIASGNGLVESMKGHPRVFPVQMCNVLDAGEYSGNLADVFKDLAAHFEWVDQLVAQVRQASIYPIAVMLAVAGFVALLFSFVVPRFAEVLTDLDVPLPLMTRIVMDIGQFFESLWWVIPVVAVGAVLSLKLLKRNPRTRLGLDRVKLRLPILGGLQTLIVLSRLTHNLALLARSGVPLLKAVGICRPLVDNEVVGVALDDASRGIAEGRQLSEILREHRVFPPLLIRMVVVGEQTGQMDESLEHLCNRYEEELPRRVKQVFGVLEPTMIVVLVGIVGFVALALFLPLLSLMEHMG